MQATRGIRKIKSWCEKVDFILSDPTEFLTVSGQGTKQGLCRWLWFAWLCLAGLLSAGCDLKMKESENPDGKQRCQVHGQSPTPGYDVGSAKTGVSAVWVGFHVCEIVPVSYDVVKGKEVSSDESV